MATFDPIERQLKLIDEQLAERTSAVARIISNCPLLIVAAGLIGGILIQEHLGVSLYFWWFAAVVCAVVSAVSILRKLEKRLYVIACAVFVGFMCLGGIRLVSFYQVGAGDVRSFAGEERTLATIRGVVSTPVHHESRDGWVFGRFIVTPKSSSFYMKVREIEAKSGFISASGVVRVQVSGKVRGVEVGDHVQLYCWLGGFGRPHNPGQFDMGKYLRSRKVFVGATVNSPEGVEVLRRGSRTSFGRVKAKLRAMASEVVLGDEMLAGEGEGMMAALILGQRAKLSGATYAAFQRTNLAHLISLSGLHMGILAGFLWWSCRTAGLSKRWRAVVCLVLITAYVMAIPPRAPTLRAAIICWFFFVSVIVRRKANSLNSISLAAVVVLLIRPMDVFNAGWQLSYVTVLGILLMQQRIAYRLMEYTVDRVEIWSVSKLRGSPVRMASRKAAMVLVEMLSVGLAAWVGCAGILLYHFGSVAPTSGLWTIVVFPLVLAILVLGFLKIALVALLPTLGAALGAMAAMFAEAFIWAVESIARFDRTQINVGRIGVAVVLLYYAFVLFWRFGHLQRRSVKRAVLLVVAAAVVFPIGFVKYRRSNRECLEVVCLDVGHGQAIFAGLPGGRNMLFDTGSLTVKDSGGRVVVPFLRHEGVFRLDAVFISHDDMDHFNGVPEIVSQCRTGGVFVNAGFLQKAGRASTAGFFRQYMEEHKRGLRLFEDEIETGGAATVRSLWPSLEVCQDKGVSDNDKSEVVLIEFAGRRILLCSDIETFAQEKVLSLYPGLKVDVVVMPHHGSKVNLVAEFVERLGAKTVIISCGRSRYATAYRPAEGVEAFYTAADGAIRVKVEPDGAMTTRGFIMRVGR